MQCVDAVVVIRLLVHPQLEVVRQHWERWTVTGERIVAPHLLRYEVTNSIRRYEVSGNLTTSEAAKAVEALLSLPIEYVDVSADSGRALALARQFNRPAAYDAHYLALAERLGIKLWTMDQRLVNAVGHVLPWVRLVQ
jgi:predicted nucleic acid-binding protein